MLEVTESDSLVVERLLQLPVPRSTSTCTSRLLIHVHAAGNTENTALMLNTNSTNGLILFAALSGQDEGLLMGYTSVCTVWIHSAVGLKRSVYPVSIPRIPYLHSYIDPPVTGLRHRLPSNSC